jgi:hypothetical protein
MGTEGLMTVSDATPHGLKRLYPAEWLGEERSLDFTLGPDVSPLEAMDRAGAMATLSLPRFLEGTPRATETCAATQAVLTELVDVTARHKAGPGLIVRLAFDGAHVTVSVGEMDCRLPAAEEEPGLYLVHRVASEVGQYTGDRGGRVTWAAVSAAA